MVIKIETIVSAQKIKMTDYDVDTLELSDIWFRSLAYPIQTRLEMIRKHYLTQIGNMIEEYKRFKEADFSTVFERRERDPFAEAADETEDGYVLEIIYRFEPQFKFIATMPASDQLTPKSIYTTITTTPGHMLITESVSNVRATELSDYIKNWLHRLDEELSSIPLQRQLEEQHKEIEFIFQQLNEIPNDFISKQEAESLRFRLDDLEERLTKNLQETVTDQKELENKIKAISDDMSALKENMNVLNKRGWAKSLVTRTFEWAKDPVNRKLLKSGVEVARELLSPGDHIPK